MLSLLYIDDEPGLLELGKLFLESTGEFTVTTALSANTGLSYLAAQNFDAIVSDFQMPEMDGIELLKQVRKSGGLIPFILFTGRGREEVVIQAINHGVDFYLQKGGDPGSQFAELAHKIRQAVSRRQAEQALNESEKRFRELVDLLPQGIYEADLTGRMLYVNKSALEMSGYTSVDIASGLNALSVIAPGDRDRAAGIFRRMVEEGTRSQGSAEYLGLRKDGRTFPVSIFSSPVIREGGIVGVRGVIMDITERKAAEDEIRAANERLVASGNELRAQNDELARTGTQMRLSEMRLRFMLGFYDYAGKSEKELLNYAIEGAGIVTGSPLGYLAFLNADESELSMYAWSEAAMAECSMKEKPRTYRTEKTGLWGEAVRQRRAVITNDYAAPDPAKKGYPEGHPQIVRHMNVPVLDEGRIVMVAGVANKPADYTDHDASELLLLMQGLWTIIKRKRSEEEQKTAYERLRKSEEELRLLKISVDQSADEVFWLDFDGRILYVNDAACRINGYSRNEFLRLNIFDLNPDLTPEIWRGTVADLRQRKTQLITSRHRRKDGTVADVEIMAVYVSQDGREYSFAFVRDITGRRRTENAIAESEEKFRALVETTSDFIWEVGTDGIYSYVSPQVREMLGYEPQELVGKTPFSIMPPEEAGRVAAEFERCGKALLPIVALENSARKKDGTLVILETSGIPHIAPDGSFAGYRGIDRDITRRKRTEEALSRLSRQDKEALEVAAMGHFEFDVASRTFIFNDQYYAMIGLTAGEAGGYRMSARDFARRFVHPDDAHHVEETIREAIETRDPDFQKRFESRINRPDGKVMWVRVWFRIEKDATGRTVRFYGVNQDITDRKHAEEALKESGERSRTILNTAQAGIVIVDADSHEIVDANTKALEMIGCGRDSVIGKVCHCFICPAEEGKCPVTDLGHQVDTSERVLISASGRNIPVLKTVVPVSIGGRNVLVESFVDISAQKQSEAAFREANRKLNLLNSITRHDIRNQLMVAQGYAQLAALNKPDPVVADFLAKISTSVETIQHQIEFTREYQELGVRAPVWFRADEIIRRSGSEKIRLTCTCGAVEIYADPMIDKVFFNLFDNASKHGTRVTDIVAGCEERACGLVITFADNGIGIRDGEKEKIFEKGYGKNTGFGLFLVREILAITGITIHETGTFGSGAVFEIVVPEGSYRIGK